MQKIRVLQVPGSLVVGGLQTVAMNCFRYIDRNEFDFDYLVYGDKIGEYEAEVEQLGGRIIHIPAPQNSYIRFYKNVKNIILKYGPYDIVHSHTFFNSGIVLSAAKRCGVQKCIAHAHSGERNGSKKLTKALYNRVMRSLLVQNADIYCACSEKAGAYLFGEKAFLSNRGHIFPNAIDVSSFVFSQKDRERIRSEFGISDTERIIGIVGSLSPTKNHLFLFSIFREILKISGSFKLLIIGDGELREMLYNKAIELGISDKIIWLGVRTDIPSLLSAMDVFIFPSLHEGFGIALLEAQVNGLPCIVGKDTVPERVWISENHSIIDFSTPELWIRSLVESNREVCDTNKAENYSILHVKKMLQTIYSL